MPGIRDLLARGLLEIDRAGLAHQVDKVVLVLPPRAGLVHQADKVEQPLRAGLAHQADKVGLLLPLRAGLAHQADKVEQPSKVDRLVQAQAISSSLATTLKPLPGWARVFRK